MNWNYFLLFVIFPELNGEFNSLPKNCTIGDSVLLMCRLRAPNGTQFVSTVPELITDEIINPITFNEVRDILYWRYNGIHVPDLDRRNLIGDISILFLEQSDFKINFTCLQELDNDTFIQFTLSLNTSLNTSIYTSVNTSSNEQIPVNYTSPNNYTCEECTVWKALSGFTSICLLIGIIGTVVIVCAIIIYNRSENQSYSTNIPDFVSQKANMPVIHDTYGREIPPGVYFEKIFASRASPIEMPHGTVVNRFRESVKFEDFADTFEKADEGLED